MVKLYRKLKEDHVVYRKNGRNLSLQRYVDAGLFTARISPFEAKGHRYNGVTMLVTAKGSRWLANRYGTAAVAPAIEKSEPLFWRSSRPDLAVGLFRGGGARLSGRRLPHAPHIR